MKAEFRWNQLAREDAHDARRWYGVEQDRPDLGEDFVRALGEALEDVVEAPRRWPIFADDLRKHALRRFPYLIIYQVRSDHILIVQVMHERGHPASPLRRVR